ncbi:MAG: PEPxxWA-CTERM sorting domain-containing protein [Sphingomonas sp.]|nr:PEPxxWA-CTERM sorting domain-containing protein [Sphingomonas sp.]
MPQLGQETYTTKLTGASALHYVFTIDGPDPDALIPVSLTGTGGISITGGGAAVAQLGFGHDGVASYWRVDFEYGKVGSQRFDVNELFYLQTGHAYSLELVAQAFADMSYIPTEGGSAFANAIVDPTFAIQGGFAQLYHFVGLPESAIGSPSGSTVPEPASWALMVGGFGLIGSAMRGRRGVGAGVTVR